MSVITFDTLELTDLLRTSGIEQRQAEADELVSKNYLDLKLAPIYTDLAVIKWMMGILLGGVLSLVMKAYF